MTDGVIAGTGNSRYLKTVSNFLTLYPTYEDFAAAFIAGTLPIDLNGINAVGWTQLATALIKANLLTDTTAAAIGGLGANPSINIALAGIQANLVSHTGDTDNPHEVTATQLGAMRIAIGTYVGTGTYGSGSPNSLPADFPPKFAIISSSNSFAVMLSVGLYMVGDTNPTGDVKVKTANQSSASGNTLSWYGYDDLEQMNKSGRTYTYIIGG